MKVYFEPSALLQCYLPDQGSENVEWVLSRLNEGEGKTSRWTLLEITRGFLKRKNLGEITSEEAEDSINFFLADIATLEQEKRVEIIDISKGVIEEALSIMRMHNIYAADAIHCATANKIGVDIILVDDRHYKKLQCASTIQMLNVSMKPKEFKNAFKGVT